jgi:hypothetical protein
VEELEFKGLKFEDYVEEMDGSVWSYICNFHSTRVDDSMLDPAGKCDCLCGVKGCENTSEFYIDFE